MEAQPLPRQQRREQHDQHRPEIVDELRLGGWCEPQRQEKEGVISKQPAHPNCPDLPWLLERACRTGPKTPRGGAERAADRKGHGGKLKRRHRAGRHGQQRQERPHQDRGEADKGG
jgi:hypothetical protein